MTAKLGNVPLSDLFNQDLYERETKKFRTTVKGLDVTRTRYYFFKLSPPEPVAKKKRVTLKRIKPKKVDTFIPLF